MAAICKPTREIKSADTLILYFQPTELQERDICCLSHQVCSILLRLLWQTNTKGNQFSCSDLAKLQLWTTLSHQKVITFGPCLALVYSQHRENLIQCGKKRFLMPLRTMSVSFNFPWCYLNAESCNWMDRSHRLSSPSGGSIHILHFHLCSLSPLHLCSLMWDQGPNSVPPLLKPKWIFYFFKTLYDTSNT